ACDVAGTPDGRAFVDALAQVSGIDVAASENTTGHAQLGGDWNLEYATGAIESTLPFLPSAIGSYREMLSHFRGGSITWQSKALDGDGVVDDVEITVKVAWNPTYTGIRDGNPISISLDGDLELDDAKSVELIFIGGETSATADYALQTSIFEARNLVPSDDYDVYYSSSARISNLKN